MTNSQIDATHRALRLLRAVAKFIDENPVKDYEVGYDDTTCDGYCLGEDCATAAEMLVDAFDMEEA